LLFAADAAAPWQRKIRRLGQTNMTEHDPAVLDVEQWADYWASLKIDAVMVSVTDILAFYQTKVPYYRKGKFLGNRVTLDWSASYRSPPADWRAEGRSPRRRGIRSGSSRTSNAARARARLWPRESQEEPHDERIMRNRSCAVRPRRGPGPPNQRRFRQEIER
jgi:hypothetical protein